MIPKVLCYQWYKIGTPAVTSRGMKEEDMALIARAISLAIDDFSKNRDNVVSIVEDLCTKFPLYE